jgi:hypothetical protein
MQRFVDRFRSDAYDPAQTEGGFHVWWGALPTLDPWDHVVECSVTLEILRAPRRSSLTFWAMQATFRDGVGDTQGVAHLGLQWNQRHPDYRGVNWGGYSNATDVSSILEGTASALPSRPEDPNTRDYSWRIGTPYRLTILRGDVGWAGWVTDLRRGEMLCVRELIAGGDRLTDMVMWTELFGRPNEPSIIVRWSDAEAVTFSGRRLVPASHRIAYPPEPTWRRLNTIHDGVGVVQLTDTRRTVPHSMVLPATGFRPPLPDPPPDRVL